MKNYVDLIMTIAQMPRSELIDLKTRLAMAVLTDDPALNMSIDEEMHLQNLIDRELDHRADMGDLR